MEINSTTRSQLDFSKASDGLIPAIVQHALSGEVLMQGFMNAAAVEKTLETAQVTFYSRSKERLWTKGEASGHVLQLVSLHTDCDADSLLALALPQGPTCHLGTRSCFSSSTATAVPLLQQLNDTIASRKSATPESSYTARLFAEGTKRAAQKVGEEGVEVALAACAGDDRELLNESADLLYHLLVVLESRDLSLNQVLEVLRQRQS